MEKQVKRTLWDRWFSPKVEEPKKRYYNPLDINYKSIINIDLAEYSNKNYLVKEIREVNRKINGANYVFVDYTIEFEEELLRLRVNNANKKSTILLLTLTDDLIYDKELHNICLNGTEFWIGEDNEETITYWRIGDVKLTQKGGVTIIEKEDNEESYFNMDYWDYCRITKDEANQEYVEYLFVEMDKNSGRIQIWCGKEIEHRITII